MNIYIAGPMKGMPDNNYPRFEYAAEHLRSAGHAVYSPAEIGDHLARQHQRSKLPAPTQQEYMKENIRALLQCSAIFCLEGWRISCGASVEAAIAKGLGYDFVNIEGQVIDPPAEVSVCKSYQPNEQVEPAKGGEAP